MEIDISSSYAMFVANLDYLYFINIYVFRYIDLDIHTGWKFAGTARSGVGGVVVVKVCLVVAEVVVALDELHSHSIFHNSNYGSYIYF